MARFHGPIGYAIPTEIRPGVWKDQIEEHTHSGDVTRNTARWSTSSDSTNDNLTVSNQFSIAADPFAWSNFHTMKYVRYMGTNWKITSIEERYPRLILTVGGVYNGPAVSGAR